MESDAGAFGIFDPTQPRSVPMWMFDWRKRRAEGLPAVRMTDGTIYYGNCGGHVEVIDHFGLDVDKAAQTGFIVFEKRSQERYVVPGLDRCRYVERREGAGGYVTVVELRARVRDSRSAPAPAAAAEEAR